MSIIASNKKIGSILLISGTCVGAGMLALPIATASAGFFDSIILLAVCWLAMWLTGLYVLEANLGLPEGANFIGMAKATLGRFWQAVTWVSYLLLLYSLMAAYLAGGGALITAGIHSELHLSVSHFWGPIPWVVVVGAIIFLGARRVDGFNRLLMVGLIIAYLILVVVATPHIDPQLLRTQHSATILFAALPVVITSFGYHVIVPSVRSYMHSDIKKLKNIIFWGSLLPLIIYVVWDLVVFGTIPIHGAVGLDAVLHSGRPASYLVASISDVLQSHWITDAAGAFIFFAIATSFLGIAFSLSDFLADAFRIPNTQAGRGLRLLYAFVPPLIFVWAYPKGFILALSYAGVFVAILHGILPALMVWVGRRRGLVREYKAPGGLLAILAILVFSIVIIIAQVAVNFQWR